MEPRVTHARKEYEQGALDEATVARDPIRQFAAWYDAAVAAGVPEPEAMTLSTATPDGRPSARIVLLRGFDALGFCFFTNYESRKGRELTANPHASLTFHWADLERQVRIEGRVERTTAAESDEYFRTRASTSLILSSGANSSGIGSSRPCSTSATTSRASSGTRRWRRRASPRARSPWSDARASWRACPSIPSCADAPRAAARRRMATSRGRAFRARPRRVQRVEPGMSTPLARAQASASS